MKKALLVLIAPFILSACEHEIDFPRPALAEGMCEYYESGFGSNAEASNRMNVVKGIFENPNIGGGVLATTAGSVYQTEEDYSNFLWWKHYGVSREYGFQFQYDCSSAEFTTYTQRGFVYNSDAQLGLNNYLIQLNEADQLDQNRFYKILSQYTSSYSDGQNCHSYYTTNSSGKKTSHRSCTTIYHYSFTVTLAKVNKSNPNARQAEIVNAARIINKMSAARMTTVDGLELGQKMGEYLGLDENSSATLKRVTEKYRATVKSMNVMDIRSDTEVPAPAGQN